MYLVFARVNWSWEWGRLKSYVGAEKNRKKKTHFSQEEELHKFGLKTKIIRIIITWDNFYYNLYMDKYDICYFNMNEY